MSAVLIKAASAAFLLAMCTAGAAAQGGTVHDHALIRGAEAGEAATVRKLLEEGAQLDARDGRGRTALLSATHANRIAVARMLIAAGADVNAKDAMQDTPFLYAGAEGRTEILDMTLAAGANLADTNRYGGTALIPAAHHGHVAAVKRLLATAIDKDHVNNLGWTALLEAVILGDGGPVHTEIVRLLVAAGANPAIADRDGITPLMHAKRRGFGPIATILDAAPRR